MKTRSIARGIVGSVAALLGVMAAGCSADVAPGDESAEVGSASQAIAIAGLHKPSDDSVTYAEAKYSAYLDIGNNTVLVFGGYDHTGAAIKKVAKFVYSGSGTGTWTQLADMNVARGEAEITLVPGNTNLVILSGGKSQNSGNNALASLEVYNITSGGSSTTVTAGLPTNLVGHKLTPCGTSANKKFLLSGGSNNTPAEQDTLKVFTLNDTNTTTIAGSTFANMVEDVSGNSPVALSSARFYHGAAALSTSRIIVAGGQDASGNTLDSSELFKVTSDCKAVQNSVTLTSGVYLTNTTATMPGQRSQFALAVAPLTVSSVAYDAILMGGTEAVGPSNPTSTFVYREVSGSPTWTTASGLSLQEGRKRPAIAFNGTTSLALMGGDKGAGLSTETSTNKTDIVTLGASAAIAAGTNLTERRLGNWGARLGSNFVTGHGIDTAFASPRTTAWDGLDKPE